MRIEKIFNNNVVLTHDDNHHELVVVGSGIAFNKGLKDIINPDRIEKTFIYQSTNELNPLTELAQSIPPTYFKVSAQIASRAQKLFQTPFTSSLLVALTDHIHYAVERARQGITLKNDLLWEIKRVYPKQFALGLEALDLIEAEFKIRLSEDEAGFISIKFAESALSEKPDTNVNAQTKLINGILNIVNLMIPSASDPTEINYQRFLTHLRFLASRLWDSDKAAGNNDDNIQILTTVSAAYPQAFTVAKKIKLFIEHETQKSVSANELSYLTIHVQRLLKQHN